MSHIGKNIKKIRTVKNISQAVFAEKFDLGRASVGAYEEGRSEPKIETIIAIAQEYSISIDVLLTKELTIDELLHFDIASKKFEQSRRQSPPPADDVLNARQRTAFVPRHKALEYVVSYKSRDFIDGLPWVYIPTELKGEDTRAFELAGSEMEYNHNGLHHGDILFCENTQMAKNELKRERVYVVVTKEGIFCSRLQDLHTKQLTFISDDPNYLPREVMRENILEVWRVRGAYSTYLNPPKTIEEKVLKLEKAVEELSRKLNV